MVTGFPDAASTPYGDGGQGRGITPQPAGSGWSFDDDDSWGYDLAQGYAETRDLDRGPGFIIAESAPAHRYGPPPPGVASTTRPASYGAPPPGAPPPGPAASGAMPAPTGFPRGPMPDGGAPEAGSADQPRPRPEMQREPTAGKAAEPTPWTSAPEATALGATAAEATTPEATTPEATASGPTASVATGSVATQPTNTAGGTGTRPHPARVMLGMATLAAERLRGGAPSGRGQALVTGVGLMRQTAANARTLARRVLEPASRIAADTADRAARLPGASGPLRSLRRSRERLARMVDEARALGQATVAAGRADAEALVRSSVAETLSWAQSQALPQIVDGLVPHLVDHVMPRLIEGSMPEIRSRVLPTVIEDLTHSPRVRELMVEEGRDVVDDAAAHMRAGTAHADDRVESAFRRLVRSPAPADPATESPQGSQGPPGADREVTGEPWPPQGEAGTTRPPA